MRSCLFAVGSYAVTSEGGQTVQGANEGITMRLSRTMFRLLVASTAACALVLCTAEAAHADVYRTSGDFSWKATQVKRLADCAATEWYNNSRVGSQITDCNTAGSNPYWDGVHLGAADYLELIGEKLPYQGNQGCPPAHGFAYIKCYYVGGKHKGNPVITIATESYGYGGITARVTWYYL